MLKNLMKGINTTEEMDEDALEEAVRISLGLFGQHANHYLVYESQRANRENSRREGRG
jgi:hypothetical protein